MSGIFTGGFNYIRLQALRSIAPSSSTLEERSYCLYIDGKRKRTQPSHSAKRANPSTTTTNAFTQAPPQDSDIAGATDKRIHSITKSLQGEEATPLLCLQASHYWPTIEKHKCSSYSYSKERLRDGTICPRGPHGTPAMKTPTPESTL
ncbi:hypothetical protein PENFLA_c001G03091 [Penicillium flavigenum]|uniref:Uncharacterized protein n=1 Tax=Penicillium flavigenum TaxID=254877 RepID=A0A1V6U205_9EURO|nr:hypothetical protein PENFLA_c001G03091 [Penicillium flavigenum]